MTSAGGIGRPSQGRQRGCWTWRTAGILWAEKEEGHFRQEEQHVCAKAESCGSIWCVLESMGIRVSVWAHRVWGKVGLAVHHTEELGLNQSFQVERVSGEGKRSWWSIVVVPVPVTSWGEQLEGARDDLIFNQFTIRLQGASVSPLLTGASLRCPGSSGSSSGCLTAGVRSSYLPGGGGGLSRLLP